METSLVAYTYQEPQLKLFPSEIYKIVAHELRHAWQYLTGKMKDAENGVLWNGQIFQWYDTSEMKWLLDDAELKQYDDQPWERDARQYAGELEEEYQE